MTSYPRLLRRWTSLAVERLHDRVAWIHSRLTKNFEAISMASYRCRRGVDDKISQLAGKIGDIDTICTNLGPKRVFGVA